MGLSYYSKNAVPFPWVINTSELHSDGGDFSGGFPDGIVIFCSASANNTTPEHHRDSLILYPGSGQTSASSERDQYGQLGVSAFFSGTGDGIHYTTQGAGTVSFAKGWFGQKLRAQLALAAGTTAATVDFSVQLASFSDNIWPRPLSDPVVPNDSITAPTDLIGAFVEATSLDTAHAHLEWHDNSNNELGFVIERMHGAGPWEEVGVVIPNSIYYDDYGAVQGQVYSYRVYAFKANIRSLNSNITLVGNPLVLVTAIISSRGGVLGHDPVVITGEGFEPGATVSFGGILGTQVVVTSATRIEAITPAHTEGLVNIVVTNLNGSEASLFNGFLYETRISTPGSNAGGMITAQGPLPSTVRTSASAIRGSNNGVLSYLWAPVVGNPAGTVNISSPTSLNTNIVFSTYVPGTYRFTLSVSDQGAVFTAASELVIVVPKAVPPRISTVTVSVG